MLPVKNPRMKPAITKMMEVYSPMKVKPKLNAVYLSHKTYMAIP